MDNKEEIVGDTNQGIDAGEKFPNLSLSVDDNLVIEGVDDKKYNGGLVKRGVNDQVESSNIKHKGIDLKPSIHVRHLLTEKTRRKKMKNMFEEIADLLPSKPSKASMTTIIDEAVNRIQTLKKTIHDLELKKVERLNSLSPNTSVTSMIHPQMLNVGSSLANNDSSNSHSGVVSSPTKYTPFPFHLRSQPFFKTWTTPNVTLDMCGLEAHISISSPKKPGLATAIFGVLAKRKIDVVHAQINSVQSKTMIKIHVRVNVAPDELLMGYISHEDLFKKAALEIMYWANSRSLSDA